MISKMKPIGYLLILFFLISSLWAGSGAETPRIGIVISKTSFQQRWGVTQMSAHGWSAVANLAGIPYDCLFLSELPTTKDLSKYDALIIGQCTYVGKDLYPEMVKSVKDYLAAGGNVIIDGPFATLDEEAQQRDHSDLDNLLNILYAGFEGSSDYRIKVKDNTSLITRPFELNQFITQHLANGLNIMEFQDSTVQPLLIAGNENGGYPFLTVRQTGGNRMALVSDFSTWAGAASFFRNEQPRVFYANQLFNVLTRTLQWTVYGDVQTPFPAPQLSNANLTAIIRLDADASSNLDAQIQTINYLVRIAKESGVVPVYAWISSGATKAGWQDLAPLGKKIEDVGGEIGTHSRFHRINRQMTERRWKEELDDAIQEIEFNTSDFGYPIGKVEFFINPGNTIHMDDYEQVASRFSFYMTHGFEQDMPLGYGNLTWYTGPYKNLAVVENNPSPDYQWFYDPSWSYTTQQITAYEEAIFDHMYKNIGHGVLFNEMWHDYSITSQPQHDKERIMNKKNIAFYDAIRTKFATDDIYCPTPVDLTNKLRAMAQWNYSWKADGNKLEMNLDLSKVRVDTIPYFTGGMGIRIDNTTDYIQSVKINGKDHYAFSDDVVILPNLKKGQNKIEVVLGVDRPRTPHLTYISKRMPVITKSGSDLQFSVLTKSKARFNYFVESSYVLVNADWQEWNRKGDHLLRAYVTSDRQPLLKKIKNDNFMITRATLPVLDAKEAASGITLILKGSSSTDRIVSFQSGSAPKTVTLDGKMIKPVQIAGQYLLRLPEFKKTAELTVSF
ncbi:MAG: hypothetical protein P8184_18975 [Calditrichia bacterium]